MFFEIIQNASKAWYLVTENPAIDLIEYIRKKDKLRDTQIQAIEVYLFLKIACENKPLYELFSNGVFLENFDLAAENINQEAREWFEKDTASRMLFELSLKPGNDDKPIFPKLKEILLEKAGHLDCKAVFKNLFYKIEYPDYLFSLPMGAGKTFLMAALIYIDLYFSTLESDNEIWARNFLVLAPSGLKSSIIPSLRTIEEFDPTETKSEKPKNGEIEISDNGLELIELLSLDCTNEEGIWKSDTEIKIDKNGSMIYNGNKTDKLWDGSLSVNKKPLRLKIRNIAGDESIYPLGELCL